MHAQGKAGDGHRARRLVLMPGTAFTSAPNVGAGALAAREERWRRKLALALGTSGSNRSGGSIRSVCVLTLRMPHPLRMSYAASGLSLDFHFELLSSFRGRGWTVSYHLCLHGDDGPESYFLVCAPPRAAKTFAIDWEASHPLGSLADLDLMDGTGTPLSRESLGWGPRPCFVCGQSPGSDPKLPDAPNAESQFLGSDPGALNLSSGAACASTRAHAASEVEAKIQEIFYRATSGSAEAAAKAPAADYQPAERIARAALSALLQEVALSPKPGLVSPDSRGSHDDMDYEVFLASARALAPFFPRFAAMGEDYAHAQDSLLSRLRPLGIEAEKAMFKATGGVNTHKGLIFSLGLLCAAAGSLAACGDSSSPATPEEICTRAAAISRGITGQDFSLLRGAARETKSPGLTAGEKLYLEQGIRGVRGEAEDGFPSVLRHALPRLEESLLSGLSMDQAALDALLLLFTVVEDTNVLSRAGERGLSALKTGADAALAAGGAATAQGMAMIADLDRTLGALNASPGGCADLLAITFFLHALENRPATPRG